MTKIKARRGYWWMIALENPKRQIPKKFKSAIGGENPAKLNILTFGFFGVGTSVFVICARQRTLTDLTE
jgi:hypothetical protein